MMVAVIGALVSIFIAIIGALLSIRGSIILQNRKLKERYYLRYIESLHKLASDNSSKLSIASYTYARDTLFLIASENVIRAIIEYEEKAVGKTSQMHDEYLTKIFIAIRKDLKLKDKNFPMIYLKK